MTSADLEPRIARMHARLDAPPIAEAANRRGLRADTGRLLEEAFLSLVGRLKPDLSVEIGAHEASYSTRLKAACPDTRVIAFEANPHVYEKFAGDPGSGVSGIDYRNLAICARSGPVTLYVPRRWNRGGFGRSNRISSLLHRTTGDFEYETVDVPGQSLDDALAGQSYRTAAAWIDAEGAQHDILRGAPGFLDRAVAIYIEVETAEIWRGQKDAFEVAEALQARGFRPVMQDRLARAQFNEVFVRDDSAVLAETAPVLDAYIAALESLPDRSGASRAV